MESDGRPSKRLPVMEDVENTDRSANWDVFLSYRGPDTKGFVSHLNKALVAAGLRPFLDCKSIRTGEDSWECIEHAIKTTRIAVVIFSETFAESEWCMRELHVILHTPRVQVIPIFYNVRPNEVRDPESGRLNNGFEKFTQGLDKKVIDEWRADLEQASQVMGFEHSGAQKGSEADLVTKVVGMVFNLANKPLPLYVGDNVIGVKEIAEGIIQNLDARANDRKVLVLGLWGMGGIGKSTLAKELYNQLCKREFQASCYIEDVTEKVNQGGVVKVQDRILKDLCENELVQIEDKSKGKVILEERLCGRRVLLVLDDVGDNHKLEFLVSRKMLSKGSLCIVTCRDQRVVTEAISFDISSEVYIHDVLALNSVDSERVFAFHAFGGDGKVKQGFEDLVKNMIEACLGVPLVLKVWGALLKGEEKPDEWKDVIGKLEFGSIMDEDQIFNRLRISYDALSQQQQGMFLDIACSLLGESRELAIRLWKSQGWNARLVVRRLVDSLVEKALITVDFRGNFRMHDHLRDMGRNIVLEERQRNDVCKRLWMPESLSSLVGGEELPDSIEAMVFDKVHEYANNGVGVNLDVAHMKKLRILICGPSINVTSSLPRSLRWLDCRYGRHTDWNVCLSAPQKNELVILNMKGSALHNMPDSIGNLSNLEILVLSSCQKLKRLPMSFGELKELQSLDLRKSGIQRLPESFGDLSNLEKVLLSCVQLKILPKSFGGLKKLQSLDLKDSGIRSLPKSFGKLSNLEMLDLTSCRYLKLLPKSFGRLKNLQFLDLNYSGIQILPKSFGRLKNLQVLGLKYSRIQILPKSFGGLKSLQALDVVYSGIRSLPESFGELSNLKNLDLSFCNGLKMLPESFGGLKRLQSLDLRTSDIQSLPESFGQCSNLKKLDLSNCFELEMLPESFGGLKSLQSLDLEFSGIRSLPKSFGGLKSLQSLNLSCSDIQILPKSFGGLKSLQSLDLSFSLISSLPKSFGGLKSLQSLDLNHTRIQSLPKSFGELSNLEELNLKFCNGLKMLPKSFGGLKSLNSFTLLKCRIQSLPESFYQLTNLKHVELYVCGDLKCCPCRLKD